MPCRASVARTLVWQPAGSGSLRGSRAGNVVRWASSSPCSRSVHNGAILPDEVFWESVIQFFVNQKRLDLSVVGPIVDYLYGRKFGFSDSRAEAAAQDRAAAQQPATASDKPAPKAPH